MTCPHCARTFWLQDWTLIERGYERYWSLNPLYVDDFGSIVATNSYFSPTGGDVATFLVHRSHGCNLVSVLPENFEWTGTEDTLVRGCDLRIGNMMAVWWKPGYDVITELRPYRGPLIDLFTDGAPRWPRSPRTCR